MLLCSARARGGSVAPGNDLALAGAHFERSATAMNSATRWSRRAFSPLPALAALLCALLALLISPPATPARVMDTTIRMAFVYSGSPREGAGWTYQHDLARQAVEKEFGRRVIVTIKENIEVVDVDTVFRNLVSDGN